MNLFSLALFSGKGPRNGEEGFLPFQRKRWTSLHFPRHCKPLLRGNLVLASKGHPRLPRSARDDLFLASHPERSEGSSWSRSHLEDASRCSAWQNWARYCVCLSPFNYLLVRSLRMLWLCQEPWMYRTITWNIRNTRFEDGHHDW